ncbi:WhiB-like protein [Rhodococcus phage E3]|uniref:WhiB-like protein n=1 Tax=Rhodococcus phage E3 TaxID=1007869 RepID=UPI0002C6D4D1|nr:WhiB-like protein [Rhodococcus phage E3]AEQ20988.1 WhiB-like protein [Rhodococcus phage E3]
MNDPYRVPEEVSDGDRVPLFGELRTVPEWHLDGVCRKYPMDMFFLGPTQADPAKAICAECPVRARCLQHARDAGERYGVWGGEFFG